MLIYTPPGIGAAVAFNLASKDITNLVLTYLSDSSTAAIEDFSRDLRARFSGLQRVVLIKADLGTVEGPAKVVSEAKRLLCGDDGLQVDVLVNNAGMAGNWWLEEGEKSKEFERMYK